MLKDRVSRARELLERFDVDAIVLLNLCNIRYLTGFTGSAGVLVLGRDEGWFLTDSRYTSQAADEVNSVAVVEYRIQLEGVASLLQKLAVKRTGFEAGHMTVALYNDFVARLPDLEMVAIGAEIDNLRLIKDDAELRFLSASADIATTALISVLDMIRPGVLERDIALALEFAMKNSGAEEKAFDFIVASGVRGALPHGKASTKVINSGELVTIDFGCVCNGYFSDETITVVVGEPDKRQMEVYSVVKVAHDRALAAVRPGMSLKSLDGLARDYINDMGFGSYFGHGLGHGVGLEVHEQPVVSFRSDGIVDEGMVFTIEPGIYIPGWGGVRIEDTVVVTADGCRVLTRVPKELQVIA